MSNPPPRQRSIRWLFAGVVIALALSLTDCETDGGVAARTQEKSKAYAPLKTWQKKLIDAGVISQGFTPDMVYMAMGKPTTVEKKELPEGHAEMWIYTHYYPNVDAIHGFQHANFTTESAYQPQRALTQTVAGVYPNDLGAKQEPMGMDRNGNESIAKTGVAQGGSMEPADLRSYTLKVLFAGDKVVQIGADQNVH